MSFTVTSEYGDLVKLIERVSMCITRERRIKLQNDSQLSKCISLSDDEFQCLLTNALQIDENILQLLKNQRTDGIGFETQRKK